MKTKHTSGPWKVLEIKNDKELMFVVKSDERMIGSIHGFYSDADDKLKADASLIAAAPEMFEVLQLIGTIANVGLETDSDYKNRMKRISEHATEILKKARGE